MHEGSGKEAEPQAVQPVAENPVAPPNRDDYIIHPVERADDKDIQAASNTAETVGSPWTSHELALLELQSELSFCHGEFPAGKAQGIIEAISREAGAHSKDTMLRSFDEPLYELCARLAECARMNSYPPFAAERTTPDVIAWVRESRRMRNQAESALVRILEACDSEITAAPSQELDVHLYDKPVRLLGRLARDGYSLTGYSGFRKLGSAVHPAAQSEYKRIEEKRKQRGLPLGVHTELMERYQFMVAAGNDEATRDIANTYVHEDDHDVPWDVVHTALACGVRERAAQSARQEARRSSWLAALHEADEREEMEKPGSKLVRAVLDKYGLASEAYLDAWDMAGTELKGTEVHLRNLHAIKTLERAHEGGAWLLTDRYGIRNFARYPYEILTDQVEQADSTAVPYGIILTAARDWNGAFMSRHTEKSGVYESARTLGLHTRVIECGTRMELARRLLMLEKMYGPGRIEFVYAEGHGSPQTITLGDGSEDVLSSEMLGNASDRCSLFLREDAPVFLESCSTGAHEGFARALSDKLDTVVTAPTQPSYGVQDLRLRRSLNGSLAFSGSHKFKDGQPATTVTYEDGLRTPGTVVREAVAQVAAKVRGFTGDARSKQQ